MLREFGFGGGKDMDARISSFPRTFSRLASTRGGLNNEAANQSSVLCVGDTIVSANGLQMNQHVRSDQMFFHHADEVATAADSHRIGLAKLFDRVFEVTRI